MVKSLSFRQWLVGVSLYSVVSFLGALWISDEWDDLRLGAIAVIGVPMLAVLWTLEILYPSLHRRFPWPRGILLASVVVAMGFGHVAWINALIAAEEEPIAVFIQGQTYRTSLEWQRQRGGLGILYRRRW